MNVRLKSILKKRKLLAGICIAVVVVMLYFFFPAHKVQKSVARPRETAFVTRGDFKVTVEAKGQFQAEKFESVSLEVRRPATITFLVPEGTMVKKGDVLAKFKTQDIENEITNASLDMEGARDRLTRAQEARNMQQGTNDTDITAAQVALRMARLTDEQYGTVLFGPDGMPDDAAYAGPDAPAKGDAYQAFRNAEFDIRQAESDLQRAREDFRGMDKLLEKGFCTKTQYTSTELAVKQGVKNLEGKKLAYQILKTYTFPQTIARNKQAVKAAENALKTARISAAVKMGQVETAYRTAFLECQRRKDRLDRRKDDLAKLTVVSPADGVLLYGDPSQWWYKEQIAVGNMIWRGMRLFTIPDLSSIIIQTKLLENDFLSATVGRGAEITVDALPGLVMKGKVTKVAQYATDTDNWITRGAGKAFDATITVDGTDPRVKSGMSCVINILIDTIANALYVPVSAVSRKGEKDFCTVVEGDNERSVEVKTGRMSEKYVQILAGLKEGQKVAVSMTAPAPGAQAGQPAGAKRGGG